VLVTRGRWQYAHYYDPLTSDSASARPPGP
jgi:hypothetical protein